MQKISDAMEHQETLMKRYMAIREFTELSSSKKTHSKQAPSSSPIKRAQSIDFPISKKVSNLLPEERSAGAAKIPPPSIKRNESRECTLSSLMQTKLKNIAGNSRSPVTESASHRHADILLEPNPSTCQPPGRTESVEAGSDVSTEALDYHHHDAAAQPEEPPAPESANSRLKKTATIKDSAAMFHKDFRAAR